jgi:geranylgeranyl transferase type-1 subunit beta
MDPSKLAFGFYCLGSLDLLDLLKDKTSELDRQMWREWIWEQQTKGQYGTGFKPSSYMTPARSPEIMGKYTEFDAPNIIMTYTALLSLAILRDDFSRLDRPGIIKYLQASQGEDGSFSTEPGEGGQSDLRATYCAFSISSMLSDWSGVNLDRAVAYIATCRTYEGGYGHASFCEAVGGTTFCALASLYLAPPCPSSPREPLTPRERQQTIRWLVHNQNQSGGFRGRTEKDADACYCFWCGASIKLLGANELLNASSMVSFLAQCQYKFGGIAKTPDENPDPYHTYLSLAAISIYSASIDPALSSWKLKPLDHLLNASEETVAWARQHIPSNKANVG